jgi:hypothetical protein
MTARGIGYYLDRKQDMVIGSTRAVIQNVFQKNSLQELRAQNDLSFEELRAQKYGSNAQQQQLPATALQPFEFRDPWGFALAPGHRVMLKNLHDDMAVSCGFVDVVCARLQAMTTWIPVRSTSTAHLRD